MTSSPALLKVLLQERHWQTYRTFQREYDKAARSLDAALVGTWPSRAQLGRWLSGGLKGLPCPDHCRVLEKMFPGWTAEQLVKECVQGDAWVPRPIAAGSGRLVQSVEGPLGERQATDADLRTAFSPVNTLAETPDTVIVADRYELPASGAIKFVTSGEDLQAALLQVVRDARECLVAVGSRSREPDYLKAIEQALEARPELVHYRILIGPPHHQVLKDHLFRLAALGGSQARRHGPKTLFVAMLEDLARDPEHFFVASERAGIVMLPSVNLPANFDTAVLIGDARMAQALQQHGRALYGGQVLESPADVDALDVLR